MTTIIGVDFSGARSDTNTWMSMGHLNDDGSLTLDITRSIRRSDLHDVLAAVPTPAVLALDFPFGVPADFAGHLTAPHPPTDMPAVWDSVASMTMDQFVRARNDFVALHGEPKRAGDQRHHRESYSPLHTVNPNIVPMTYHGINLLHRWHRNHPGRWHVPPLASGARDAADEATLLELMPGALLRALQLPYKGYKRGRLAADLRARILDGLAQRSGVPLPNLDDVRENCLANDDCLDSVVAAVGAACWARDSTRFRHPDAEELPAAALEGWIYVPRAAGA